MFLRRITKSEIPRAKNIFVGYCEKRKGYRLIDPKNPMRATKARDVVFIDDRTCNDKNLKEDVGQNSKVELQPLLSEHIHEETSSEVDTATQMVAEEKLYTKEKLEMGNQQSQDIHSG